MASIADEHVKSARVLVVEGDEEFRNSVMSKLGSIGFTSVEGTAHGREAIAKIAIAETEDAPYDLVVLDLVLPDIDGSHVLNFIKRKYDVPVVALTESGEHNDLFDVLDEATDDIIVKPVDVEVLLLKSEKALAKYRLLHALNRATHTNNKLFLNVLQVMAKTLEAKDPYTRFHSENVAKFARIIARRIGLSDRRIEQLNIAGILHDFGKIGIMEGILNKPGSLNDEEFAAIRKHPLIASAILEPIKDLTNVVEAIRHHHEDFDGTGYPYGLKGEDIPLGARILRVADAFDAMTSRRSYHEPKTSEQAVHELKRCSGREFDPKVVEVFLEFLREEVATKG